jgi:peroxiredoxin
LRDDIERFATAGAQVVAVAPDTADGVAKFVDGNPYPFPLLPDADQAGVVRFDSIGTQQWQIPSNENVLAVVSSL